MIKSSAYKNKSVGILGLGISGMALARSLLLSGAKVLGWDEKKHKLDIDIDLNPDVTKIQDLDVLFVSPGFPYKPKPHRIIKYATSFGIPISSDIEFFMQENKVAKSIGITGTNGKSTTTMLINHIFKKAKIKSQVGGNIGTAVCSLKQNIKQDNIILELSSFQLDLLSNSPAFDIAIMLNISPDHIDRHVNIQNYVNAKFSIFKEQEKDQFAIIVIDDQYTKDIYEELKISGKQHVIPISTTKKLDYGISIIDGVLYDSIDQAKQEYDVSNVLVNAQNLACAYMVAKCYQVQPKKIIEYIRSFQSLAHRMEVVKKEGELTFINDSKATNINSAEQALKAFDNIYWIAGGISKDGGIEPLSPLFHKLQHVFLVGSSQDNFANTLEKYNIEYTKSDNIGTALQQIAALKLTQGSVLLSPACASFDQYTSFEKRGEHFKLLINKLF